MEQRLVVKALRAIRQAPDTRALKRELRNGNPYAHGFLARRGLTFEGGAIATPEAHAATRTLRQKGVI